jgi:hypothetical protein
MVRPPLFTEKMPLKALEFATPLSVRRTSAWNGQQAILPYPALDFNKKKKIIFHC